nr:hypothetical protein [Tanacetum cinerariifolium]
MGKSSRNKKRAMENLNFFYLDVGTSSSVGVKRIKGEALKEKDDSGAFIFPIRLEGQVNKNALADTGSDINSMPYRIYETLGREDMKKFLILDIPIDRDSPIIVGRGFLRTIGCIVNTPERLFLTFDGLCRQTFRAARSDFMTKAESDSDDGEDYQIKSNKFRASIYGPKPTPYLNCSDPDERSLAIQTTIETHDDEAGSSGSKRPRQHETIEELCHEFYSTYEFDEVCVDDELQTKKIIKFRLGGCAHSLPLLEFAQRLGLYQAVDLEEEGFNVYFEGGLRSDEHFNAQDYWLSISREENLGLSRSHTFTIRNSILRVINKMITYGLCQRTSGYDKIQKNDLWVLTKDVVRSLSALIYYRDLDTITDFYDVMGMMEIRQETIERMKYRQSYHWDRYHGVIEHMAGVYNVPLLGAYNPPRYAQPQYDQYYQQYPPPSPQYQQQQQDDE